MPLQCLLHLEGPFISDGSKTQTHFVRSSKVAHMPTVIDLSTVYAMMLCPWLRHKAKGAASTACQQADEPQLQHLWVSSRLGKVVVYLGWVWQCF